MKQKTIDMCLCCRSMLGGLLLIAFVTQTAHALTLNVMEDSYSNQAIPTKNNDAKGSIANSNQGNRLEGFVRFDLSALPKNVDINLAMLRLWVNRVSTPGRITLYDPTNSIPLASLPIAATAKNHYVLAGITQLVKSWQEGLPNSGIALRPDDLKSVNLALDSKENTGTNHPMEIEVALAGPIGPPGDPGIQGPQGPVGSMGASGIFTVDYEYSYLRIDPSPNYQVYTLRCRRGVAVSATAKSRSGQLNPDSYITASSLTITHVAYRFHIKNTLSTPANWELFVLCAVPLSGVAL